MSKNGLMGMYTIYTYTYTISSSLSPRRHNIANLFSQPVQKICLDNLFRLYLFSQPVWTTCLDNLFRQSVQPICLANLFDQPVQTTYLDNLFRQPVQTTCSDNLFRQPVQTTCLGNLFRFTSLGTTIKVHLHIYMRPLVRTFLGCPDVT